MSDQAAPRNPFSAAERLLEHVGVIPPDPDKRHRQRVYPVVSKLAEEVGMVLGKAPHKLFLRGETVMKIEYNQERGDLDFADISESEFVSWVERYIDFGSEVKGEDGHGNETKRWVSKSIQPKTAKLILTSPQFRACLPRVLRQNRVRLPALREPVDGEERGKIELLPELFDERSGVFTFPSRVVIDESWSVQRSLDFFLNLYGEFPHPLVTIGEGDAKRMIKCPRGMGACIASGLGLFAEGLMPANTLRMGFFFNANLPRSGKSLLGKLATAPVTGIATGLPLSQNDDSLKTFVDSALLTGQSTIFFDNVKGHINSQILESLMTMPYWNGRTMHTQRNFVVKNAVTIYISGNNATTSDDTEKRFVWVNLQSETADPATAKHSREIDDTLISDPKFRSDILSALWALVKHWDSVGRPGAETVPAGFRAWADVVGGIVCAAAKLSDGAISDPLATPDLGDAGGSEPKHMRKLVRAMVLAEMRVKLSAAMATDTDMDLIEDDRVIVACKSREISVNRADFKPADVIRLASVNGLFDWFLPEVPEGKDPDSVVQHKHRVRLGDILTARSGKYPRGMKYLLEIGDDSALWRLSHEGEGRHKRYIVHRDASK